MECGDQREVSSRQPSPNQTLADVANDICAAVKQEQEADQAMSSEVIKRFYYTLKAYMYMELLYIHRDMYTRLL